MRLFLAVLISVAFSASASLAAERYYRVVGVAQGDVLNIRAEPRASSEIIGTLQPGAGPVEIVEEGSGEAQGWGRVVSGEGNGWVAMRFLAETDPQTIGSSLVPSGLVCMGTEPFWDLEISDGGGIRYKDMEGAEFSVPVDEILTATARRHRFALSGSDGPVSMTAVLGRFESCSDGMSGRDYGWRIDLIVVPPEGFGTDRFMLEGCCMLPLPQ